MNENEPLNEEELAELLRHVVLSEAEPVPPDVQARLEARLRQEAAPSERLDWRRTAAVSAAAGVALSLGNPAEITAMFLLLVAGSVTAYGLLVREMLRW